MPFKAVMVACANCTVENAFAFQKAEFEPVAVPWIWLEAMLTPFCSTVQLEPIAPLARVALS